MGDKATAKATIKAAGVPCIPGSEGLIASYEVAAKPAEEIGYPVMIKLPQVVVVKVCVLFGKQKT